MSKNTDTAWRLYLSPEQKLILLAFIDESEQFEGKSSPDVGRRVLAQKVGIPPEQLRIHLETLEKFGFLKETPGDGGPCFVLNQEDFPRKESA